MYAVATSADSRDRGVQILNITDPNNPTAVGKTTAHTNFMRATTFVDTVEFGGKVYALIVDASTTGYIYIVNVSDPTSPTLVTNFRAQTYNSLDAFVYEGRPYALIADTREPGLKLLNLQSTSGSAIGRPVVIDTLTDDNTTYLGANTRELSVVEIDDSLYAVVTHGREGVQIVQLLSSADILPKFDRAQYSITNPELQITFDKDLNGTATNYTKIHVRDLKHDSGGIHLGMAVEQATDGDTVTAVFDGTAAEMIAAMAHPTLDIDAGAITDMFDNHILAISDAPVVTTRPFNIVLAAEIDDIPLRWPNAAATWSVSGDTYMATAALGVSSTGGNRHSDGLQLYNITNPYDTVLLSTVLDNKTRFLASATDVAFWNSGSRPHLAVTIKDGIRLFDVTNPANPQAISFLNSSSTSGLASGGRIDAYHHNNRDYLAVASGRSPAYLLVVDVTDPANPVPGGYRTDNSAFNSVRFSAVDDIRAWTVAGSAYVALGTDDDHAVTVFNLSNPAAPRHIRVDS